MKATEQTLAHLLARLADQAPEEPAISCGQQVVSRRELDRSTNRLARVYRELGVTPGSLVTIGLPNGPAFLEAVIATWKCGATPQPVLASLPAREVAAIVELADPSLVVGVPAELAAGRTVFPAGAPVPQDVSEEPFDLGPAPSWKAPTSGGSTGRPKLIVSTAPAVASSVVPFAHLLHMRAGETVVVTGPLAHNGPLLVAACALVLGCPVVVMPRFDAAEALDLVERHAAGWLYLVPTMMSRIWRLGASARAAHDLSSLRVAMHMAAPCAGWLKQSWIDWLGPERVLELFTATEVQAATILTGQEWLDRPGTVGRPVLGEITVLDEGGHPVPPGTVGELWMRRGEHAAPTYRYIGAQARRREGGWESVGDLGRIDEDGYVYLADRAGDLILVGGANVYPAEVESVLLEHPAVVSCAVVGIPHEDLGQVPHAVVQLDRDVSDHELVSHARERLAPHKVPRTVERVERALRDDAGKLRRSALRPTPAPVA